MATIEVTESKHYDLIGRVTEFEKPTNALSVPAAPNFFPILA